MKLVKVYLQDIFDSILKIEEYTKLLTLKEFDENDMVQDSVLRRLEIIGEAAKRIPKDYYTKYPQVAWRDVAKLRDLIIHHYEEIETNRIWIIIKKDIPQLKEQIKNLPELKNK